MDCNLYSLTHVITCYFFKAKSFTDTTIAPWNSSIIGLTLRFLA